MKRLLFILLSALPLMFISCNSDTDNTKPEIKKSGLSFSMTEEEFDSIEVGDTRAQAKPISSEFVDLGDGIEAEVQISESGTHIKPRTRAIINKHYSIRAYQGGVLKGSMKGTFNGSTFTPDASSATKMILEPGSYNFVCYNDKFQEVGNNLELNINDAKEAYICQTTQEIYGYTAQQHITFNMRHACSRIEVFLECYGKLSSGTTASVTPVGTSAKTKLVYVGATNSFTQTAGSISPSTLTFSGAELTGTNVFGAVTADKKIYLLPGTDFTKLQMKFTGGTFGKNRNMSDAPAFNFTNKIWGGTVEPMMKTNTNYLIRILLWPKFKYLFSDGTTGTLSQGESQGKKRIGVVVREKTGSSKGLAMALSYALSNRTYLSFFSPHSPAEYNTTIYPTIASLSSDMDGEKWTWEPSGNKGGVVRANDQTRFPGFYAAGHYAPGVPVTGSNIGRWFVPSAGQMIAAFDMMANTCGYSMNWSGITDWGNKITYNIYYQTCFSRQYPRGTYNPVGETLQAEIITSTQWQNDTQFFVFMNINSDKQISLSKWPWYIYEQSGYIRPFVHF